MAFFDEIFDDIGKKISQAGQTVVQKTKDFSDVSRINGLISDEEKKINNNYSVIGKLYYTKYADTCDAEFATLVASIKESESKLAEYKQQIKDIKGTVHCEKCGAELTQDASFCNICGAPVATAPKAEASAPQGLVCSGCGSALKPDMKFCTTCGKPVSNA